MITFQDARQIVPEELVCAALELGPHAVHQTSHEVPLAQQHELLEGQQMRLHVEARHHEVEQLGVDARGKGEDDLLQGGLPAEAQSLQGGLHLGGHHAAQHVRHVQSALGSRGGPARGICSKDKGEVGR